ncbi:Vps62-related protein [Streptomyces klenkii]
MPRYETFKELTFAFTTKRALAWSSLVSMGEREANFWLPQPVTGVGGFKFRPLGTNTFSGPGGGMFPREVMEDLGRADGPPALLVAPSTPGGTAVAHPTRYQRLWWDAGTGAENDGALWRPIPPAGYVALGDVWWTGWSTPPPLDAIWCVKAEHARRPSFGASRWSDWRTGGKVSDVEVWAMDAPPISETDVKERILLPSVYDTALLRYGAPSLTDTSWIIDAPADVKGTPAPKPPAMTSHDKPTEPVPVTDRIVRVPFTAIKDPDRSQQWKIENSPFYTVQRQVGYKAEIYIDNRHGTVEQPQGQDVTTGFSREESETFTETTSITVSASAGIAYKAFSAGVGVSITREIGYERRTSVTEFSQVTQARKLTAPPRSAAVLWVETHHLEVYRSDGTMVGVPLKFQFPSYVIGEYPANAGARHTVAPAAAEPEIAQPSEVDWETGAGLPQIDIALLEQQSKKYQDEHPDHQQT